MFFIRNEQLDKMEEFRTNKFINRAYNHLRNSINLTNSITDKELLELIRLGISDAKTYEIETEVDIVKYIKLIIKYGKGFNNQDRVKRILQNHGGDTSWAFKKLDIILNESINK
jgi:hypothetical protein